MTMDALTSTTVQTLRRIPVSVWLMLAVVGYFLVGLEIWQRTGDWRFNHEHQSPFEIVAADGFLLVVSFFASWFDGWFSSCLNRPIDLQKAILASWAAKVLAWQLSWRLDSRLHTYNYSTLTFGLLNFVAAAGLGATDLKLRGKQLGVFSIIVSLLWPGIFWLGSVATHLMVAPKGRWF